MSAPYRLYLLFTVSWFLHMTSRIPGLGVIRLDLLLVVLIAGLIVVGKSDDSDAQRASTVSRLLILLACYSVVTLPFVEWPGSVIQTGLPNFIKAIVFYYFTVSLLTSVRRLKIFVAIFLACQIFRVAEPVYLHITEGYWGSGASMSGSEHMARLSGAPSDIVNPNGLAFIIDSVLPFIHFLSFVSWRWAFPLISSLPALLYALVLTASRSGFVGMIAIMMGICWKSKNKLFLLLIFAVSMATAYPFLSDNMKDRYLSLFSSDTKNAATAAGRTEGTIECFRLALRRPLFGHGLGTSRETNANFGQSDQPAHNLYAEVLQELGIIGLVIYLFFIKATIENFIASTRMLKESASDLKFLTNVGAAMQVWLFMNLLFSFASYGLSSYEWYLFAGFSVVLHRQAMVVSSS